MTNKALRLIIITVIFIAVGSLPDAYAQPQLPREYLIKASYLYNFAKFVEWPEEVFMDSGTPITIGILGKNPFGKNLDRAIREKTAQGRNLIVENFKTIDDLKPCHILFVNIQDKETFSKTLDKLEGMSVLTVSEIEGFAELGGVIGFFTEKNKIRFEINMNKAERAGLKISSRLLKLAKIAGDRQ